MMETLKRLSKGRKLVLGTEKIRIIILFSRRDEKKRRKIGNGVTKNWRKVFEYFIFHKVLYLTIKAIIPIVQRN